MELLSVIEDLIARASSAGLDLTLGGGRVQVVARAGAAPSRALLSELRDHQEEIVAVLASPPAPLALVVEIKASPTPGQQERFRGLAARFDAIPAPPRAWGDFTDDVRYLVWRERVEAAQPISPAVAFLVQAAADAMAALAEPDADLDAERGLICEQKPGMKEWPDPFLALAGLWG
jgi:hypothetical protein